MKTSLPIFFSSNTINYYYYYFMLYTIHICRHSRILNNNPQNKFCFKESCCLTLFSLETWWMTLKTLEKRSVQCFMKIIEIFSKEMITVFNLKNQIWTIFFENLLRSNWNCLTYKPIKMFRYFQSVFKWYEQSWTDHNLTHKCGRDKQFWQ